MTFVFKASLFAQGRQLILRTNSFKRDLFISLNSGCTRQAQKSLVNSRFYSSEEKNLPSQKLERLYNGTLTSKMRFVKMFSLATSTASILVQPYLLSKVVETGSKLTAGGVMFAFGFFAFVTPVLLHIITKRYVIHVDYNPVRDTYIATTYSLFVRKKELEFRPEDVQLPIISEMLTTCIIKGVPMFIDVRSFTDLDHYKRIMGFDKPMDFSLNPEDIKSSKN